jgi:hypothetical protein
MLTTIYTCLSPSLLHPQVHPKGQNYKCPKVKKISSRFGVRCIEHASGIKVRMNVFFWLPKYGHVKLKMTLEITTTK